MKYPLLPPVSKAAQTYRTMKNKGEENYIVFCGIWEATLSYQKYKMPALKGGRFHGNVVVQVGV